MAKDEAAEAAALVQELQGRFDASALRKAEKAYRDDAIDLPPKAIDLPPKVSQKRRRQPVDERPSKRQKIHPPKRTQTKAKSQPRSKASMIAELEELGLVKGVTPKRPAFTPSPEKKRGPTRPEVLRFSRSSYESSYGPPRKRDFGPRDHSWKERGRLKKQNGKNINQQSSVPHSAQNGSITIPPPQLRGPPPFPHKNADHSSRLKHNGQQFHSHSPSNHDHQPFPRNKSQTNNYQNGNHRVNNEVNTNPFMDNISEHTETTTSLSSGQGHTPTAPNLPSTFASATTFNNPLSFERTGDSFDLLHPVQFPRGLHNSILSEFKIIKMTNDSTFFAEHQMIILSFFTVRIMYRTLSFIPSVHIIGTMSLQLSIDVIPISIPVV